MKKSVAFALIVTIYQYKVDIGSIYQEMNESVILVINMKYEMYFNTSLNVFLCKKSAIFIVKEYQNKKNGFSLNRHCFKKRGKEIMFFHWENK